MYIHMIPGDLFPVFGVETYSVIILYLGPESMMPIASALAGIVGAILMFWQRIIRWKRKFIRYLKAKTQKSAEKGASF